MNPPDAFLPMGPRVTWTRKRVLVATAVATVLLIAGLSSATRGVVMRGFGTLETLEVRKDIDRLDFAYQEVLSEMNLVVGDWAPWDDTYAFVRGERPRYVSENIDATTLDNLGVDGLIFFDASRRPVYAVALSPISRELVKMPSGTVEAVGGSDALFGARDAEQITNGVVETEGGHVLVAAAPITDSSRSKAAAGTLVAVRRADARLEGTLIRHLQLPVIASPATALVQHDEAELTGLGDDSSSLVTPRSSDVVVGSLVVPELGHATPLAFSVEIPRTLHQSGLRTVRYLLSLLAVFGLAAGAVVVGFFERRGLAVYSADLEQRVARGSSELERSEARFQELVQHMAEGLLALDVEDHITYANHEAQRILGMEEPELLDRPLRDVLGAEAAFQASHTIDGESAEFDYEQPDGSVLPLEATITGQEGDVRQCLLRDVGARKRYEERLLYLASHDHLTGLLSRSRFEEELDRELSASMRAKTRGAVLWFDLDHFKDVNDSFGHRAGDDLLIQLSTLLRENTRAYAPLARLGGDEFAMLLPYADLEEAEATARRLVSLLDMHRFEVDGHGLRLSASIGVVCYPDDGRAVQELLSRADIAMYRAKAVGAGTYATYSAQIGEVEAHSRLEWADLLRSALETDSFVVHAQPIAECATGRIASYELLLRLPGQREGELIMPNTFLPVAERIGIIRDIDRWMVKRAVELLVELGDGVDIDVNVSGKAFSDPGLLDHVAQQIARSGIEPRRLGLEITETAAISDISAARELAQGLRAYGCRLSLDDFGSGFASFYYLRHLPIDRLKIDGDFVRHLTSSESDRHLVRAMVEIGQALGVRTVAEFIEDDETLELVKEFGVDYAQGYFIGRPGPVEELVRRTIDAAVKSA